MLQLNQKGLAPVIIVVGILVGLTVVGGGAVVSNQMAANIPADSSSGPRAISVEDLNLGKFNNTGTASALQQQAKIPIQPEAEASSKPISAFDRLLQRLNLQPKETPTPAAIPIQALPATNSTVSTVIVPSPQATPTPESSASNSVAATPTPTPTPTSTNTSTSTPTPSPTPTPQASYPGYAICEVHTDPTTGTAPVSIKLIYAMAKYGNLGSNSYVSQVQWDWNGDGAWDTEMSADNLQFYHTYDTPGTYPLRMQLKLNAGYQTQVCTGSITIN